MARTSAQKRAHAEGQRKIAEARGTIASRSGSSSSRTSSVNISGNTVFINGSGYSVAPSLQAEFIKRKTGGRGSSSQAAIQKATAIENARKAVEKLRRAQKAAIEKLLLQRKQASSSASAAKFDKAIKKSREDAARKLKLIAPRFVSEIQRKASASPKAIKPNTPIQVADGVWRVRDPVTGKLVVTEDKNWAITVGKIGLDQARKISKEEAKGDDVKRLLEEVKRRGQTIEEARIFTPRLETIRAKKEEVVRRRIEVGKLDKLKKNIERSRMSRSEKNKAIKQIEQKRKTVIFQSKLRTGEIKGFSGTGLSGSQLTKRKLLIQMGVLAETSSRNGIGTVDPLRDEFFIDTKPTVAEKESLNQYMRRKQNEFNTEIRAVKKTPTQKLLNKFNLVQKLKNQSISMENMIFKMRKTRSTSEIRATSKQFLNKKQQFQLGLIKASLIPVGATQKQIKMLILGFSSSIFKFGGNLPSTISAIGSLSVSAIKNTPSFVKKVAKDPKAAIKSGYTVSKSLGKSLLKGGAEFGKLAMAEPGLAIGMIGAEFFILKGVGKGFKIVGKVSAGVSRPLNPFFKTLKDGKIILRAVPEEKFVVRGATRLLKKRVKKPSFKRPFSSAADFLRGRKPGQFKKFTKNPGLILEAQTVASGATPLSAQAAIAGKEVTAVNAAADQITGWLRRKKVIRKPILAKGPGKTFLDDYKLMPKRKANILRKFDEGKKLTNKEFAEINVWLQKTAAPNITLLERSLYADPTGGLRLSRLGISGERTARLRDILRGNFTLKGSKPQISVFEKVRVEKFPKSLSGIKKKILAGKPLTLKETNQLIRWQTKQSGMFKPIGSTIYAGGTELEVTLAPGEIIKRVRKAGFTVVNGKKVSIVMTEIYKPSKSILKKIKLAQVGNLTKAELKKLERFLSKQTSSKIRIETPSIRNIRKAARRRARAAKPVLRAPRGATGLVRPRVRRRAKARKAARPGVRAKPRASPRAKARVKPRISSRAKAKARPKPRPAARATPGARPRVRPKPRARPKARPKKKPPIGRIRLNEKFTKRKISKNQPVFYIKVKKKGRIVNLAPRPLILRDAKDYLAHKLDKNLVRTAYFEPIGRAKNVVRIPPKMRGYFTKVKRKLRPYKIRVGKKKQLRNGFIEKRKYALDTKREKAQLKASKKKRKSKKKK